MKWVFVFLGCLSFFFISKNPISAADTLKDSPNNKFGIHLTFPAQEDLQDAAGLVNSSGGDWGWVTLVIEEKDRQINKWQQIFDQMRQLHLIPIIRLATSFENSSWRRPLPGEAQEWADFLNSLNWVVKNRYVILFNEPNHAGEWGGQVDPESYGRVAFEFAKALKNKNSDFLVMLAGFDSASPHEPPNHEDEELFLRQMFAALPEGRNKLFDYLDIWASHSYPNHGFVGSPWAAGRNSVKNYLWELGLLKKLEIDRDLPVFITETGWPHAEGKNYQRSFNSQEKVAENFKIYFNQLINEDKVRAITPFVLNYPGEPFEHFSWKKAGSNREFYPQYQTVYDLPKIKGEPEQVQKLKILSDLPQKLITGSTYQFLITVRNEGQAIWSRKDGYQLNLINLGGRQLEYIVSDFSELKPYEEESLWLYLKTGEKLGKFDLALTVSKNGTPVSERYDWALELIPTPYINFKIKLFPKITTLGDDFKVIIYNQKDEPIFEKTGVKVVNGTGIIESVKNLAIGEKYRVVILKPNYLPRQEFLVLREEENKVAFEQMLPLDFNLDGKFSLDDFLVLSKIPKILQLLWPN